MLPLNSLFSSVDDIETVVLLLLFIVFFSEGFSYLVTTGWIVEISLCENSINQSIKAGLAAVVGAHNVLKVRKKYKQRRPRI